MLRKKALCFAVRFKIGLPLGSRFFNDLVCFWVNFEADKNSDLVNIFKGFINPQETACAKIAHQYVEILSVFQNSLKTVQ